MKKDPIISLLLAAIIGIIYLPMLAPSVAPQGDSGELVTTAYFLSVAHPPGYPLYILLGNLFTKLPWGEVAWRVNLMSMVLHLSSLLTFVIILRKITSNSLVALFAAAALAFSYNFWLYSLVAEVFALNDLIALIILYLAIDIYFHKRNENLRNKLAVLALFFGLGLANHQTIIFMAAPVVVLIWNVLHENFSNKWKFAKLFFLPIVFGLIALVLPYTFFYFHAKYFPPTPGSWNFPDNWLAVVKLFFRSDYGTFTPTSGFDPSLASITDKIDHVVTYLRFALDDFGFVGIVLASLGAIFGVRKFKKVTTAILVGFLTSSVVFLSYANFPYKEVSGTGLEIIERFYLLPNLFLALLIGLGLSTLFDFSRKISIVRLLFGPLIAFYILSLFIGHHDLADQKNNYLAANLGKNILYGAPHNSLIALQGDIPTFVTFYERYVMGVRSDVEFLTPNQTSENNRFKYLKHARPNFDLTLPMASSPEGILKMNPALKISSTGFPSFALKEYISSPSGLLFEIKKPDQVEDFQIWDQSVQKLIAGYRLPTNNLNGGVITLADSAVYYFYDQMYTALGDFCRKYNQIGCGEKYYLQALNIEPRDLIAIYGLGRTFEDAGLCDKAQLQYQKFLEITFDSERGFSYLADLAMNCYKDNKKADYYTQQIKKQQKLNDL